MQTASIICEPTSTMSQQNVYKYITFTSRKIGLVNIEEFPQTLENKIIGRFGSPKFIRGLTEPLQLTLNAATKLYEMQFKLPEVDGPPSANQMVSQSFQRVGEIWTKLEEDLKTFAREEENNMEATAADGIRIIGDALFVSPIQRFHDVLDRNPYKMFLPEISEYLEKTNSLIISIVEWLEIRD